MNAARATAADFLTISPRIRVMPIIHGSGDFAIGVREELLNRPYECVAVPLPPSFQDEVEEAVDQLPTISVVVQVDAETDEDESAAESESASGFSYVPIDPCQGVIAAIRTARGERIAREFIDMETPRFVPITGAFPDPYALKRVSPERFAAAILPAIPPPVPGQNAERVAWMAHRLRELETRYRSILLVCSVLDWPWIRDAFCRGVKPPAPQSFFSPIAAYAVDPQTLTFVLGELPYVTGLYERGRRELLPDDNLSVDGVKELVLDARERLKTKHPKVAERITPQLLSVYFRYIRNLSLLDRRLTPDFYTLIVAAKQTAGDDFALALAETARTYPYARPGDDSDESSGFEGSEWARMGIDRAELPIWGTGPMVSRLPGQSISWRTCELRPKPLVEEQTRWRQRWDPFGMCSWPPEDDRIESFHRHVRDQARAILGADLARTEKFTTSVRDGIDIRETLRNWHTGDLYVKVVPPSRGSLEVVVFLFEFPADPEIYTNRTTWYAEHAEESTLAFYATDPMKNLVGPGIAQAQYGGALFIFPPRPILDVWADKRLDFTDTLEERLLGAAFLHSNDRHVAVVSPIAPPAAWRRLARKFGRKIVHLPLKRFGGQLLERLRTFHVLNGKHVRSYAADFIRDL
jgi:hypothetical protein